MFNFHQIRYKKKRKKTQQKGFIKSISKESRISYRFSFVQKMISKVI